jgi:hypothetical protein
MEITTGHSLNPEPVGVAVLRVEAGEMQELLKVVVETVCQYEAAHERGPATWVLPGSWLDFS